MITELGRSFYRPYIYQNSIDDYHIADTLGNSFGTMTAIFIILTLSGRGDLKDFWLVLIITLGLILYELSGYFTNAPVDIYDIFSTLIFGFISAVVYFGIIKRFRIDNEE